MAQEYLVVRGAREHNLKNISVSIPRNRLTVITGLSGSGKSSLAFDTIYAEGQRRYVESLSAYARQFLGLMEKPDVDAIEGLSPAISIEQKTTGQNPRSTVGTVTEIYDYLRLLWARVGVPHCPNDGTPVARQSAAQITDSVLAGPTETRIEVLAPIVRGRKGEFRDLLDDVRKRGFVRVRVDGETYDLGEVPALNRRQNHDIAVVVDRLVVRAEDRSRLNDSIETALKTADGVVEVVRYGRATVRARVGDVLRALRLSGLRTLAARAGAAPVLVQLAVRRLSRLPRRRHPARGERRPGARRSEHLDPRGRDPALGRADGLSAQGRAAHAGQGVQVRPERALGRAQRRPRSRPCSTARPAGSSSRPTAPGAGASTRATGKACSRTSSGATRSPPATRCATALEEFMIEQPCQTCGGKRLKAESLAVLVHGHGIGDVVDLPVERAVEFFEQHPAPGTGNGPAAAGVDAEIAGPILKEVGRSAPLPARRRARLPHARAAAPHRSRGGETQRIRLATQIGSRLVGVLYILDEPSIGLHQRDNERLLGTLRGLRDLGNTVIVVEHDDETIEAADHVIDLGPRAGRLRRRGDRGGHGGRSCAPPDVAHRPLPPRRAPRAGARAAGARPRRSTGSGSWAREPTTCRT